jgi:hypothetical protein
MTWPNGFRHYLGEFSSVHDARQWIKENRWLTAERIDDKDLVRHGSRGTLLPSAVFRND